MKVWQIGISDCEASYTEVICTTKEIAIRELFKLRNKLINDWKEMIKYDKKMYQKMINNLSSDDYENWDNYPHEVPWICETEVIDK